MTSSEILKLELIKGMSPVQKLQFASIASEEHIFILKLEHMKGMNPAQKLKLEEIKGMTAEQILEFERLKMEQLKYDPAESDDDSFRGPGIKTVNITKYYCSPFAVR